MIDLDELKRLALDATPGPWFAEEFDYQNGNKWIPGGDSDWYVHNSKGNLTGNECNKKDATFIAAANPAVILELIRMVREGM